MFNYEEYSLILLLIMLVLLLMLAVANGQVSQPVCLICACEPDPLGDGGGTAARCSGIGIQSVTAIRLTSDITLLDLSSNPISQLPANAFALAPNLTTLDLTSSSVSTVDDSAFAGLSRLHTLVMSQMSQLETLSAASLAPLVNLEVLSLAESFMLLIQPDLLAGNPKLRVFEGNALQSAYYPPGLFAGTPLLESVVLGGAIAASNETTLDGVFSGLAHLREIVWYYPLVVNLSRSAFEGLASLETLTFDGLYVKNTAHLDAFAPLNATLKHLTLNSSFINGFNGFDMRILEPLPHLQSIVILIILIALHLQNLSN